MKELHVVNTFLLGWAELPLPSGVGQDLSGFLNRENPSVGERDPLFVRALWLADGRNSLAWASIDALAVNQALVKRIHQRVTKEHRLSPRPLILSATHTHSAPATIFLANCGLVDREWNLALEETVARAISEAARSANRKVRLRVSAADAPGLCYNRRTVTKEGKTTVAQTPSSDIVRQGPLDPTLTVLTAHDAATDRPVAALVHFACHPVFFSGREISADWPGITLAAIRREIGGDFMPVFVQGADGDVNPSRPSGSPEDDARAMGIGVADKAIGLITDPHVGDALSGHIKTRQRIIHLPWRSLPDEASLRTHLLSPPDWTNAGRERQALHLWAKRVLVARSRGWWRDGQWTPLQTTAIGEMAVVALGAEVFTQTAIDLKSAFPKGPTIVATYANDAVGYLAPAAEYEFGGYEIERAHRYYGYPDAFSPDAEAYVQAQARQMLHLLGS